MSKGHSDQLPLGGGMGNQEFEADEVCLLDQVFFSAKIDYLKIATNCKVDLPTLDGQRRWARKENFRWLTVHDATPSDVQRLYECLGDATILEIEIAVDARPRASVENKAELLERFMIEVTAMRLNPAEKTGINKDFRAFYRHHTAGGCVGPFNMRLPKPTDQQLHGGRHESSQVKAYHKRVDMGQELARDENVARTEARLGPGGLRDRGLTTLSDLFTFKFRRQLMPFFTHVRGVRRQRSARQQQRRRRELGNHAISIDQRREKSDAELFQKVGVGAFLKGGAAECAPVVFLRDTAINDRIGQALTRLEKDFAACEFVCFRTGTA